MPKVNPEILSWARDQAGLTPEEACRKIFLNPAYELTAEQRLQNLESGEIEPTRAMLVHMAKAYRRPLVTFYMSRPPRIGSRGQDFRTLPEARDGTSDALLDALIRNVQARQSIVREAIEDADEVEIHEFIGSRTREAGRENLLKAIRKQLNFNLNEFAAAKTADEAFSLLRQAVEAQGIFVILRGDLGSHHTALDVRVFRGFALADPVAPFIVINDRDSRSAWSFTLLHELVHLWLGQTGISAAGSDLEIEQFCNDIASEFLLPTELLLGAGIRFNADFNYLAESISELASTRNISSSMVAYKLFRLNRIERPVWYRLRTYYRELWLQQKQKEKIVSQGKKDGPDFYVVRKHRVGNALINLTGRLMRSGALTTSKAGLVLGVKAKQVEALL